jgi:hypothetical protein
LAPAEWVRYRARDASLSRDIAIKILPSDLTRDPSRIERFTREARAALDEPVAAKLAGVTELGAEPVHDPRRDVGDDRDEQIGQEQLQPEQPQTGSPSAAAERGRNHGGHGDCGGGRDSGGQRQARWAGDYRGKQQYPDRDPRHDRRRRRLLGRIEITSGSDAVAPDDLEEQSDGQDSPGRQGGGPASGGSDEQGGGNRNQRRSGAHRIREERVPFGRGGRQRRHWSDDDEHGGVEQGDHAQPACRVCEHVGRQWCSTACGL